MDRWGSSGEGGGGGGEEVFLGYAAEHGLTLTLPIDQDLLNRAFKAVATSASEPRVSISFDVENKDALRQRVLWAAVEDARRSARTMAEAADIGLGEIIRIEYGVLEAHVTSHDCHGHENTRTVERLRGCGPAGGR